MKAGFAIAPGPLVVAVLAPVAGRIAARRGQRALLLPGGLVYGTGAVWLLAFAGTTPDYWGTFLPANLLTGLGVALCLPQLSSVAVQQLPPDRSATGSGISQSVRQMGQTLGVALFVAVLGVPGPGEALDRFQRVWLLVVAGGVVISLAATRLHRFGAPAAAAATDRAAAAAMTATAATLDPAPDGEVVPAGSVGSAEAAAVALAEGVGS